jgi:hypothetical protein
LTKCLAEVRIVKMAESTTGYIEKARPSGQHQVSGTFRCPCGGYRGGIHTVTKGTTQSWTCNRCKRQVVVHVPK